MVSAVLRAGSPGEGFLRGEQAGESQTRRDTARERAALEMRRGQLSDESESAGEVHGLARATCTRAAARRRARAAARVCGRNRGAHRRPPRRRRAHGSAEGERAAPARGARRHGLEVSAVDAEIWTSCPSSRPKSGACFVLARRLLAGQRTYGCLDLASDRRDWRKERADELADALVYGAIGELAGTLGRAAP